MGSAGRPSGPGKPRNEVREAVAEREELDEMAADADAAADAGADASASAGADAVADAGADAGADGSVVAGSARAAAGSPADPGTQARHAERAAHTSGDNDGTRKA